jgi:hypothetical protein
MRATVDCTRRLELRLASQFLNVFEDFDQLVIEIGSGCP